MRLVEGGAPCPCGGGAVFSACCGPYLGGAAPAPTAEALMRSRYCAYVCRDTAYLLRTWDPAHRPPGLDLKDDRTQWLGLRIVTTVAGGPTDPQGEVEFIARFRSSDGEGQLHERSRFRRAGEAWLYVDGDIRPATQASRQKSQPVFSQPTVGRNDPCPCGSGKKWKRCCGM